MENYPFVKHYFQGNFCQQENNCLQHFFTLFSFILWPFFSQWPVRYRKGYGKREILSIDIVWLFFFFQEQRYKLVYRYESEYCYSKVSVKCRCISGLNRASETFQYKITAHGRQRHKSSIRFLKMSLKPFQSPW